MMNLYACVKKFRSEYTHYTEPANARGACATAAQTFLEMLVERGVVTDHDVRERRVEVMFAPIGPGSASSSGPPEHAVLRLGRIVIDWTHRQFDPACAFPLVYDVPEGE